MENEISRKGFMQRALLIVPALALLGFKPDQPARIKGLGKLTRVDGAPVAFEKLDVFSENTHEFNFLNRDLFAYVNNIKLSTIESLTYTISTECIHELDYGPELHGDGFKKSGHFYLGKRMITGSMVFSQYDRHPVLDEVLRGATKQLTSKEEDFSTYTYSAQIPPFDLTLIGDFKLGGTSSCTLFNIQIVQETSGWTQEDLGVSMGVSFVANSVSPWQPVKK